MFDEVVEFIQSIYNTTDAIPLHEPKFFGNEKKYVSDAIDSSYVSSVGPYVDKFEKMLCQMTGAKHAIATVNGTAALHAALVGCEVNSNDEVITQPLTFIATANAVKYQNAEPVFIDVDKDTLGLSPSKLEIFLNNETVQHRDGYTYNKNTKKRIKACIPMHTFGHPAKIDDIVELCNQHNIDVIEDAAESFGSQYNNKFTGTFGKVGIFSFNGNKIITAGGGGAILTDDSGLAKRIKHFTTTAKLPHPWEITHDQIGFNYRLPGINAALACAQLEMTNQYIDNKRQLAKDYEVFFKDSKMQFVKEPVGAHSNYWLNCILLKNKNERDSFISYTNKFGVSTRPAWRLIPKLEMYKDCQKDSNSNAKWLEERIATLPSSVTIKQILENS